MRRYRTPATAPSRPRLVVRHHVPASRVRVGYFLRWFFWSGVRTSGWPGAARRTCRFRAWRARDLYGGRDPGGSGGVRERSADEPRRSSGDTDGVRRRIRVGRVARRQAGPARTSWCGPHEVDAGGRLGAAKRARQETESDGTDPGNDAGDQPEPQPPRGRVPAAAVAMVAPTLSILGGQAVQADQLLAAGPATPKSTPGSCRSTRGPPDRSATRPA